MPPARTPKDRLIYPLAAVVAAGWSASLIAGFVTRTYIALEVTTPVMLIVTGYVFGVSIVRSKGGNGDS